MAAGLAFYLFLSTDVAATLLGMIGPDALFLYLLFLSSWKQPVELLPISCVCRGNFCQAGLVCFIIVMQL